MRLAALSPSEKILSDQENGQTGAARLLGTSLAYWQAYPLLEVTQWVID
jgi:hypothetical protein